MQQRRVAVIGLGYVGLPVAVALAAVGETIGFDIDHQRIAELQRGIDRTRTLDGGTLKAATVRWTAEAAALASADFYIVAVPTPVDRKKQPDLRPLLLASRTIGERLQRGAIVVFESTLYPGAVEYECAPVLAQASNLRCGEDFWVGYSPERINPGDAQHRFSDIVKVVAGQTPAVTDQIAAVYRQVVPAGVYKAPSIQVAEAAKAIENTQRDLNIALMNELALICHRLHIDTGDVLAAAQTKWNFLPFSPGLVGGHCISVDPYYLASKAIERGYNPEIILAGRRINDRMGEYIANQVVKLLIHSGKVVKDCVVTILGFAFKENIADARNTRVIDIVHTLRAFGLRVQVCDPEVDAAQVKHDYGIQLLQREALATADCVLLAVAHECFVSRGWAGIQPLIAADGGTLIDIKRVLPRNEIPTGINLWRL